MNYETRLKELQTSHQLSLSHDLDFMTKLRKKAYEDCEKLFHPAAAVESNEGVNHK